MQLEDVVRLFSVDRKINETSYQVKCPVHNDKNASLTISERDGKILMYCHAGCSTEDIVSAVGLTMDSLDTSSCQKEAIPRWQKGLESKYDYYDPEGNYVYSKLRYEGKRFFFGYVCNDSCDFKNVTKDRYLYNIKALQKALNQSETVFIVEGEKDVETMKKIGLTATTSGGAKTWTDEHGKGFAEFFKGADVVIVQDNDNAGKTMTKNIIRDIKSVCSRYKVVVPSAAEHGDVTDYLQEGHSKEELLELVKNTPWDGEPPTVEENKVPPLQTYTLSDLDAMNLQPPEFLVDDFLPVGLGVLCAPSKLGKSWFAMNMAIAITRGDTFLGYVTHPAAVLYMALEDSLYRIDDRAKKVLQGRKIPQNLHIAIHSQKSNDGLLEQISEHLKLVPDTRLIIIDTLQMIRPQRGNRDAYEFDYEIMGNLKSLTIKYNIGILFIHHTRKSNGRDEDPFENILGSTALQGATDYMYVIKKNKNEDVAMLHGKGRDFEAVDLAIKMNWLCFRWENLGGYQDIEEMRLEQDYVCHPAIITLKYKLAQIEEDPDMPIKAYIVRAKDFRDDVAAYTKEIIGTSEKNFMTEVSKYDAYLARDGIRHEKPVKQTTLGGKTGQFHKYYKV